MKKPSIYLSITTIMAGVIVGLTGPTQIALGADCKDVQFVFARGVGATHHDSDEWRKFEAEVDAGMAELSVSYGIYEAEFPTAYINFFNALPTKISAGNAFAFGRSVSAGAADTVRFYKEQVAKCSETRFVLAGYSQGAKVLAEALGGLEAERVLYVAALGDPKLYLPEGVGTIPPACRGEKLSRYRMYVPNCNTDSGVLGARKPYEVAGYEGKFGLWCNDEDLICGSSKNLMVNGGHVRYDDDGQITAAVEQAILRIRRDILGEEVSLGKGQAMMDTAILIDSTGSMTNQIARYKAEALRLAKLTLAGGGRVALYEYRDLRDPFDLRQLCDFDCSLLEFEQKLNAIVTGGGGDEPESLLNAALGVMNSLRWKKGITKSIVVLTDATYHLVDWDGTTVVQVVKRSLEIDPVNIYVITEENVRAVYVELTELTGGKVFGLGEMEVATDYIVSRPVAALPFEKYYGAVGERFYFDASESYGVGAEVAHFEWDLNGDGVFERVSQEPLVDVVFDEVGEWFVVVKVVAEDGGSSTMSAAVTVSEGGMTGLSVPLPLAVRVERVSENEAVVSWRLAEGTAYALVAVNGVPLGYVPVGVEELWVGDLDFDGEIEFAVAGMDAEFNVGESRYALLGSERGTEEGVLAEASGSETAGDIQMHDLAAGLAGLRLPGTGVAMATKAASSEWWALVLAVGLGAMVGWWWRKRRYD